MQHPPHYLPPGGTCNTLFFSTYSPVIYMRFDTPFGIPFGLQYAHTLPPSPSLASPLPHWTPFPLTETLLNLSQFFSQGDLERALGQPVSPLIDRTEMGITKSQPGFFNVVAIQLFKSFCRVFPGGAPMMAGDEDNCASEVDGEGGGRMMAGEEDSCALSPSDGPP